MIHDKIKQAVVDCQVSPSFSDHYVVPSTVYYDNLPEGITPEVADRIRMYDEDYLHSLAAGAQELFTQHKAEGLGGSERWGVVGKTPMGEINIYADSYSTGDATIWASGVNVSQDIPHEVKEIIDQIDEMMNSL